LIAASHDGSSQVIPQYYDKAVHYDDQIDQAKRNAQLGWTIDASVEGDTIVVTGAPAGADVHVTGYPRAHADRTFALAGVRSPLPAHGILDVTIAVDRGPDHFVQRQTLEAP
jgi:nitrogen fixation protein FixH